MSTYTDLKNRVKETITVGFRPEDRVTTQKVRFYNEENEYWGSFSGSLTGNVNVFGGKLSSVDVYNATLVDPVIKTSGGMIIELGTMADQLEELSVYAHEDLSDAISACVKDIRDIRDAISAVPVDTADQLSALSGMIGEVSSVLDFEISARISSDQALSSEFAQRIRDLASRVAEEDSKLRRLISDLSDAVDGEVSSRISADDYLSASLMKYTDDRRHYDLTAMDAAPQMPIKATEFAVNRLVDYDLPDGFVVNQDKNQLVGWVEKYDSETGNCRFTAYSDARYPSADYAQILGANPYTFDSNVSVRQCPDAVHQLVYSKSAGGQLSDNSFDIRVLMPNIRMLRHDGRTVGYVYNAGTEGSVSSGTLQFIPSQLADDPVLSSFADDREVTFSVNVNGGKISGVYTDCELQLISAQPAFFYRTHLSSWPRALLSGGFEEYDARVYRDLVEEDGNGQLKSFAVSMIPAHSMPSSERQNFFLSSSEGFRSVVHEYDDRSLDVLEYDADAKAVRYFKEEKYLSGLVWVQEHGRRFDIPLCALQANTGLSSAEEAEISFAVLSNAVADALKPLLSATYQLRRVGDALAYSMATADEGSGRGESVVIQIQNSGRVYAEFQAPNEAKSVFDGANSGADFSRQGVYEDKSAPHASCGFDFDAADFSGVDQLDGGHGRFQIGAAASEGDEYTGLKVVDKYAKFGRPSYGKDEIVIEIPDKTENSRESREFLFVLRPRGAEGRKATVRFVTPAGDPIQFFAEHKQAFEIDCEKFITFRLQEIVSGKFALLDWDQSVQESRLDDIDRRLAGEVRDREQAVSDLSAEVFEELSSHDSRILSNRNDIDFLLWADRRSMVYFGTLLSADTGSDKHLSCYFRDALGHAAGSDPVGPDFMFKTGFTYRLSAEQTDLFGPDGARVSLYPKDIITFSRDARLSSVCAGDFDVVNDYNAEIYGVSSALCAEIQNLSTALSGEIDDLSAALSEEIDDLSAELTGLVSSTSAEITGTISAVSSDLSAAIDAKFTLSVDFSELSSDFRELSGFVGRTLLSTGADEPGLMKIRDEYHYPDEAGLRNYDMRMINGTIWLHRAS